MYLRDVPHDQVKVGMVVSLEGEKGVISDFLIGLNSDYHGYIHIDFLGGRSDTIAWWPFLCNNLSDEDRRKFHMYGNGYIEKIEVVDE